MEGELKDEKLFAELVQAVFAQRRKTLRNTLKPYAERDELALKWDLSLRPEQLSLEKFIQLANDLAALREAKA